MKVRGKAVPGRPAGFADLIGAVIMYIEAAHQTSSEVA